MNGADIKNENVFHNVMLVPLTKSSSQSAILDLV